MPKELNTYSKPVVSCMGNNSFYLKIEPVTVVECDKDSAAQKHKCM